MSGEITNYLVTKVVTTYRFCSKCQGTGKARSQFRGRVSFVTCSTCGGTCREAVYQRTEIPLWQALEEIEREKFITKQ